MVEVFTLNPTYSTTKLCYKLLDDKYLDENEKIKEEYKFKLNFPELGIIDSKIPAKDGEKFDTYLFLPEGEGRKGEGGLRTKGYFKFSYKKGIRGKGQGISIDKEKEWWIVDENDNLIEKIDLPYDDLTPYSSYSSLPLITIITVVYNGEKYLEETIQSVINQTYPNVEYIIIDGGSTDGTLDIIKKYEDYIDYWISEKDRGISDAFNKGLRVCNGVYIQTLNAGDFLISQTIIEEIVPDLLKNEDIVAYQSRTDTGNNFPFYPNEYTEIKSKNPKKALDNAMISHQGSFIKRDVYKEVGGYKEEFKIRMDFELFMRIEQKFKIKCINRPIVIYSTNGISSNIFNRLDFKLEEVKIVNLYYKSALFNVKFYLSLPFYLFKKLLSHFYYQYFRG